MIHTKHINKYTTIKNSSMNIKSKISNSFYINIVRYTKHKKYIYHTRKLFTKQIPQFQNICTKPKTNVPCSNSHPLPLKFD